MGKWRFDRTTIFFAVVIVLFFWDLIYFLGIDHLPHPFRVFRLIGDSDLFRGFRSMLRQMIFLTLPSSLVGIAVAHRTLVNRRLADALLRFLRLGIWLPFLLLFAVPTETIAWTIAAAVLSGCYNYLVARALLNLEGRGILLYVGRETILQIFFFLMLAQIPLGYWIWFNLGSYLQPSLGFQVLAMVAIFIILINWIFRSNFEAAAQTREIILRRQIERANWSSLTGALLITTCCFLIWQAFAFLWFYGSSNPSIGHVPPLDVFKAGIHLIRNGEIWSDIGVSLLEIFLGLVLCCSMAFVVAVFSIPRITRMIIYFLLPLTYVAALVLYSQTLVLYIQTFSSKEIYIGSGPLGLWQKVLAVGYLTLFPFFQSLCGLSKQPVLYRVLLALDDALPFAFVAMLFGEAMAATAGLGFSMIVASATYQWDKALAAFLITAGLLVCLSSCLRWVARRFYTPAPTANAIPAQAA